MEGRKPLNAETRNVQILYIESLPEYIYVAVKLAETLIGVLENRQALFMSMFPKELSLYMSPNKLS